MLAELEEIIQYKQVDDQTEIQMSIRNTWAKRLSGCQRYVDVWQRILRVRLLVVSPQEDQAMWVKFANLCRKSGRANLAHKTLVLLFGTEPTKADKSIWTKHPLVTYSYLKYSWSCEDKQSALNQLITFTNTMLADVGNSEQDSHSKQTLLARCYLKIGEWKKALIDDNSIIVIFLFLSL